MLQTQNEPFTEQEFKQDKTMTDEQIGVPDSAELAQKLMYGIAFITSRLNEAEELAQARLAELKEEMDTVKSWIQKKRESATYRIDMRKAAIERYVRERRQHDSRYKLETPVGTASIGRERARYLWDDADEGAVMQELEELGHSELIRVRKSIDKPAVKKAFTVQPVGEMDTILVDAEGQVLESLKVEPGRERLNITLR